MEIIKNNKGITLVTLVITVIIMLILAGVTLNMVMGDNGIIEKAKIAKQKIYEAQEEENIKLANLENRITNRDLAIDEEKLNKLIEDKINEKTSAKIFIGNQLTNILGNSDSVVDVNNFTVTEDGKYIINYVSKCNWGADGNFIIFIYKNNVATAGNSYSNAIEMTNECGFLNVTDIQELKKNDVIKIKIYQYNNGNNPALAQNDLKLIKVGN